MCIPYIIFNLFIYFTFYGTDMHPILLLNELKYSGLNQLKRFFYLSNIPNGYNLNCFNSKTIFLKIGVQVLFTKQIARKLNINSSLDNDNKLPDQRWSTQSNFNGPEC